MLKMIEMKKINLAFLSIVLIAGCATSTVTNVIQTGPDTYMVAAEGVLGNSSTGLQLYKAQEQAALFCGRDGKQIETVSKSEVEGGFGKVASATVYFKCLKIAK